MLAVECWIFGYNSTTTQRSITILIRQNTLELAMSIANDLMDIDFESAAEIDIGSIDDNLDFMSGYDTESFSSQNTVKQETKSLSQVSFSHSEIVQVPHYLCSAT